MTEEKSGGGIGCIALIAGLLAMAFSWKLTAILLLIAYIASNTKITVKK